MCLNSQKDIYVAAVRVHRIAREAERDEAPSKVTSTVVIVFAAWVGLVVAKDYQTDTVTVCFDILASPEF